MGPVLFQTLFDEAPDATLVIDAAGAIVAANATVARTLGYAPAALIGQPIELLLPGASRGRHRALRAGFAAQPTRRRMGAGLGLRARKQDGTEIPVDVSLAPIEAPDGPLVLCVVRDLSEQRASEQALQRAQDALRQAQKLEAIGQLAAGIAHDFNNLLAVILARCDLLAEVLADGQLEDLKEIKAAGARASVLTRQLLSFSRKQMIAPRVLSPNAVIEEFARMIRRTLGANIDVELALDGSARVIKVDQGLLEQALLNLAINARDAMPHGGRLTISTSHVVAAGGAGEQVAIVVHDTGRGMSPEIQARIFEPFFTTKERGHGTGLGLATVHGIIAQAGGTIAVDSEPGRGTRFEIRLPATEAASEDRPERAPRLTSSPTNRGRGSETILLLDDDDLVLRTIGELLRRNGYTTLVASNAGEALLHCARHPGAIDVLVTDIVMPDIDGFSLAQDVVAARPDIKVIYMSGYTDHPRVRAGVIDGTLHFVEKPFQRNELTALLRAVLDPAPA